ncbi:cytochrome-c peroxidase [Ferruginibacter sp.]
MVPVKKFYIFFIIVLIIALYSFAVSKPNNAGKYISNYTESINGFSNNQRTLLELIKKTDFSSASGIENIRKQIALARTSLKGIDFWLRYLDPIAYKKINGPLPVEWETEVFEKFEKPYKREGAGLTLAALYLDEKNAEKDSLLNLVASSITATQTFMADSVTGQLQNHHHFFLANRLFLLNLAAIYTTGFECPDTTAIIPELHSMLIDVKKIYSSFNESFPATPVAENFLTLYNNTISFVNKQPLTYSKFDHFIFIRDYVNPLFKMNQQFINQYRVFTKSYVDYSLNNSSESIFNKHLYFGQNTKGIFLRVNGEKELKEIERIGKLLFYDPLLSGNNKRSCNSCHKSAEYFTDTAGTTSFQYDGKNYLSRNSPSLINATYNHLLMLDGKHISMQNQAKDVITNALELGSNENELVQKVLSCNEYKKAFKTFLKYTPQEKEITLEHIVSAITMYYSKFSNYYAPFDDAMNTNKEIEVPVKEGFNLFMSKAQCGTCHFVPQFNGVKPPYISSEFEVLGVPADTAFIKLSIDKGRYDVNPAGEMLNAFRTGSIRNAAYTKPYMHNGVFNTLQQVIDFYDAGGGAGKGLKINNQTLSADSLKLTADEKKNLIVFIRSLNENINFETAPEKLPVSKDKLLNSRKIGGEY